MGFEHLEAGTVSEEQGRAESRLVEGVMERSRSQWGSLGDGAEGVPLCVRVCRTEPECPQMVASSVLFLKNANALQAEHTWPQGSAQSLVPASPSTSLDTEGV